MKLGNTGINKNKHEAKRFVGNYLRTFSMYPSTALFGDSLVFSKGGRCKFILVFKHKAQIKMWRVLRLTLNALQTNKFINKLVILRIF